VLSASPQRRSTAGFAQKSWFNAKTAAVFAVWLVLAGIGAWMLVFVPAMESDLKSAEREADICEGFLATEMTRLRATSLDWANWDDLEQYLLDSENDGFAVENVTQTALQNLDIDGMLLIKPDGQLQRREVTGPNKSLYPGSAVFLERIVPLRVLAREKGATSSIFGGEGHLFVVAVAPVLGTDATGAASGEVIIFSLITDAELSNRPGIKGADIELLPPKAEALEVATDGRRPLGQDCVVVRSIESHEGTEVAQVRVHHFASRFESAKRAAIYFAMAALLLAVTLCAACSGRSRIG